MADLTAEIPDEAFVAVVVAVSIRDDGQPVISHALSIPNEDYDSLARASAPHALRMVADRLDADAPGVITIPHHESEED